MATYKYHQLLGDVSLTCAMSRPFNSRYLALNLCTRVLADAAPPERLPETETETNTHSVRTDIVQQCLVGSK